MSSSPDFPRQYVPEYGEGGVVAAQEEVSLVLVQQPRQGGRPNLPKHRLQPRPVLAQQTGVAVAVEVWHLEKYLVMAENISWWQKIFSGGKNI